MDTKAIKQVIGSLDTATDRRVWALRKQVLEALKVVRDQSAKIDLKLSLRRIDERLMLV